MEQSINRVELLGRTGNRPTLRHTPNGTPVTQFSLYTNQLWRNAAGELCEAAERQAITAWGQLAIQCCNHLHKGSRVHITGRLQTRRWDDPDTGEVRLRTEIIASEVIFLGGIQTSQLPPDYDLPEQQDQMAGADGREVPIDERDARWAND
jgi:single-strand DNA-binding protein